MCWPGLRGFCRALGYAEGFMGVSVLGAKGFRGFITSGYWMSLPALGDLLVQMQDPRIKTLNPKL